MITPTEQSVETTQTAPAAPARVISADHLSKWYGQVIGLNDVVAPGSSVTAVGVVKGGSGRKDRVNEDRGSR